MRLLIADYGVRTDGMCLLVVHGQYRRLAPDFCGHEPSYRSRSTLPPSTLITTMAL